MSEPAPSFRVTCECGHSNPVTALQAGTEIQCRCGKMIEVPSLGQLRQTAGLSDLWVPLQQRIQQAVAQGHAPSGKGCGNCGSSQGDRVNFFVDCEQLCLGKRDHSRLIGSVFGSLWRLLILGKIWADFTHPNAESAEARVLGRNVSMTVPMLLCKDCRQRVPRLPAPALRSLLSKEKAYGEIFATYPDAEVRML